jgi:hypothetical protein
MDTMDRNRAASLFEAAEEWRNTFRKKFDQEPFLFRHRLSEDPRFEMSAIRSLAQRLPRKIGYTGDLAVDRGFKHSTDRLSFEETLNQLEAGRCWIILKCLEKDPEYGPLLPQYISEIEELTQREFEPLIESRTMSLILSSPGQVTPYHIDADCNCLFQIRGCKTFYTFNGKDRSILPEDEEEKFWAGEMNAAHYREQIQDKAWSFVLAPGNGVHVPVIFPHWVKNSENVSVSLSINFRFHGRLRGDVYRMNHILRKIGLRPRPVGQSIIIDRLKTLVISPPRAGILMARRLLHRKGSKR